MLLDLPYICDGWYQITYHKHSGWSALSVFYYVQKIFLRKNIKNRDCFAIYGDYFFIYFNSAWFVEIASDKKIGRAHSAWKSLHIIVLVMCCLILVFIDQKINLYIWVLSKICNYVNCAGFCTSWQLLKNNKENNTYVMDIRNKYPWHSIFFKSWDLLDTLCCQLY